jgi:P4 family phage/plasmid primase-like protien
MPNASVCQRLHKQYHIDAVPGAKVECPFCSHHTFGIHRDDSLAKCFHSTCGRFITAIGSGDAATITLSSVLADIYHDFHQELLMLKSATYPDNAYAYLVQDRKIHPRVVEDAMLGAIPGEYDLDRYFTPLIESIQAPRTPPPKRRGRPKKTKEHTPEDRQKWMIDQREKLRTCLLKHAGWLAFFYADATHRIVAIRFRKPGTRYFTYFKPYQAAGLFGHDLFRPHELNGLQAYLKHLIITEGEFNQLQLQSLLMRMAEAHGKDSAYVPACAVGGVNNSDWSMVQRLVKIPILVHDHDAGGASWVEDARQLMAVDACTTPLPSKDLDEYIRTFGDHHDDAWAAVKSLIHHPTRLHRLYSGTGVEFFGEHGFIPKRLGDAVLERHHLRYSAERLWAYRDGVYHPDGEHAVKQEAHALLGERRHEGHIQETLRYLEVETYTPPPEMNPEVINVQHGRFSWRTKTMAPHTPEVFDVVQLPLTYDPNATCSTFDRYCQTTFCTVVPGHDPEVHHDVIKLIEEVFGHCIAPDTRWEKTIMLIGEGENGKSVLLDTLTQMLGHDHVSHVALQDLSENRFQAAELLGKLANIFADLDDRALTSTTHFKMLTTGDPITAERKYERPFTFKNYAQMLFSANRMPPSRDRSYAFYRRWVIVPFTRTFKYKEDGRDGRLREKLYQELPGIFNRALTGLIRLYEQEGFTVPKITQDALGAYQRDNDTVSAFAKECLEASDTGKLTKQDLFRIYRRWCAMSGFKPVNQRELKKSLAQLFPKLDEWRPPGGKGPWQWTGITLNEDGKLMNMPEDQAEDAWHE